MNIFVLDESPVKAAEYHCNKHVVKMILEYTQLLCTAHRVLDGEETIELSKNNRKVKRWKFENSLKDKVIYSATHVNHPSAVWVRESSSHYWWLYNLLKELHYEYKLRYDKTHKCFVYLKVLDVLPKNIKVSKNFKQPPQAMPEDYKCEDSIKAYRNYYINAKAYMAKWTSRQVPTWFKEGVSNSF